MCYNEQTSDCTIRALLLFETKYYKESDHTCKKQVVREAMQAAPSVKALLALRGLLHNEPDGSNYITRCKIRRIVLVFCVSNTSSVAFKLAHIGGVVHTTQAAETDFAANQGEDESPNQGGVSPGSRKKSLKDLCKEVQALGCTVSLHAVDASGSGDASAAENAVWKSLLMQSLYYVVPDMEGDALQKLHTPKPDVASKR